MCGIASWFMRESVPSKEHLFTLFHGTEARGQDGFGVVHIDRTKKEMHIWKTHLSFSQSKEQWNTWFNTVHTDFHIGDIIMCISRAAPETETATLQDQINETLQPIFKPDHGLVLIHNGAVCHKVYKEMVNNAYGHPDQFKFETKIDSEAIAAAYVFSGRNIKKTCEYLSGGFAVIMYDSFKDQLYVWNDFKPIAQAYVRGHGYLLSSDNENLGKIVQSLTGTTRDGICMWENYYHHYMSGGSIREMDMDSGFMKKIKYSPRYITQTWDSNEKILNGK